MNAMLPTAWWLFWWALAVVVTAGLVGWLVLQARREDQAGGAGGDAGQERDPGDL